MAKGGRWVALQGPGDARCVNPEAQRSCTHWRAGCVERMHGRFGKGRMEKDQHWHLVSRLLHIAAGLWQLWLACWLTVDAHLPWERRTSQPPTPGQAQRGFAGLLLRAG